MSTKTTFKRIALVAVAALGFGTLSVAPSNAASLQKITLGSVAGVQTTTGTTSAPVTTLVNINGFCDSSGPYANTNYQVVYTALPSTSRVGMPAFDSLAGADNSYSQLSSFYAPADSGLGEGQMLNDGNYTNVGGANFIHMVCGATGRYNTYATVTFTPDVAGTYSLLIQDPTQSYTQTTWTVTVAAPAAVSAAASSVLMSTGSATPTTVTDAVAVVAPRAASSDVRANIAILARNSATANTATSTTISATITGPGLISFGAFASAGRAVSASGNTQALNVYSDGTAGVGTITISSGTTVLATKTVSFAGAAATLAVALKTANPTWIAPTGTTVLTVSAKDAAGIAATVPATTTATSSATTVATVGTVAGGEVTVTGVAAGTAVITIADSATGTSATYTVTVKAATTTAAATLTFDKTEYNPGELMTITVGADIADNAAYAAFTAVPVASANLITVKNPFAAVTFTVALVSGKATWTAYAPLATGPLTLMATTSAGPATAATVTATATIISDGIAQAAADAAAEATDAANAATDAANAAAEASDAATAAAQDAADAIAALSVQVSEQIAELKAQNEALRKQLIALTNLIIKIQKKVKA